MRPSQITRGRGRVRHRLPASLATGAQRAAGEPAPGRGTGRECDDSPTDYRTGLWSAERRYPGARPLSDRVADCTGCHTAWEAPRDPGLLAGGNEIGRDQRTAFSSNLTRHESGVGYPRDTFIAVMRSGKGGSLHPIMPWVAFMGLTASDLGAMYDALGDAYPVAHYVGNVGEPRHCIVCGQQHPFGEHNVSLPESVPVPRSVLERLPGTYRSDELDWTIEIRLDHGKLFGGDPGGPETELIALSETRYLLPGLPAPLEFRMPAAGAATSVVSLEIPPIALDRVP